jgi:hypothetical protein
MTMSLSITVGILLAMIITVHSANSCLITLCRIASVVESIEVVTSSRTRILFLLSSTLPRKKLHHCLYSHKLSTESLLQTLQKKRLKRTSIIKRNFLGFIFPICCKFHPNTCFCSHTMLNIFGLTNAELQTYSTSTLTSSVALSQCPYYLDYDIMLD